MTLTFPFSTAGQAVADLYTAGTGIRTWLFRHGLRRQQRLRAKVISIGNIAWGGTGKTPFTIWLAQRLSAAGWRPSILTRGYGRTSAEPVRIFFPGASPEDARTDGDEVQLYLRHSVKVPLGIAASRYTAGRTIEERFRVDVHLLDDGFQHLSLARDLDIVLLDARNPWAARWGLSRVLRESPRALRRAHAMVITNCNLLADGGEKKLDSLREKLRRINPGAPQFLATTRLTHFVETRRGRSVSPDAMKGRRALAFCGIGNPENFFAALNDAGVRCLERKPFHDHHAYRVEDLKDLAAFAQELGADCLLTTEKDLVNLPAAAELDMPLYWAAMQFEVQQEAALLGWIAESLGVSINSPAPARSGAGGAGAPAVAAVSGVRSH